MGSSRRARRAFLAIAVAAAGVLVGGVVVDGDRPSLDVAVGEGDASPRSRGTVPSETTTTTDLAEPETPAVETSTTASTGRPAAWSPDGSTVALAVS